MTLFQTVSGLMRNTATRDILARVFQAHESPRGVEDANLDRQTANFVNEGYYELKDLLEDDIWESSSSIPQRFRQKFLNLVEAFQQQAKATKKAKRAGLDIVDPIFFKDCVELRDKNEYDWSPLPEFSKWLDSKKSSERKEDQDHAMRTEDRVVRFLVAFVDGVHRRFAHDINLFAACAVFDPSLRSKYKAPDAAKRLTVLKEYFPDIIKAEVFAQANSYFSGEPESEEAQEDKAEKASNETSKKNKGKACAAANKSTKKDGELTVTEFYTKLLSETEYAAFAEAALFITCIIPTQVFF